MKLARIALVALALSGPAAVADGSDRPAERAAAPNVRLEIELVADGTTAARYEMIALGDGSPGEIVDTTRVPIRVTRIKSEEGGDSAPVTTHQYQDVGFRASIGATVLPDGRIRLRGHLEQSSISEGDGRPDDLPRISAYSHNLRAVATSGEPLEVAAYAGARSAPLSIRLVARVLP